MAQSKKRKKSTTYHTAEGQKQAMCKVLGKAGTCEILHMGVNVVHELKRFLVLVCLKCRDMLVDTLHSKQCLVTKHSFTKNF